MTKRVRRRLWLLTSGLREQSPSSGNAITRCARDNLPCWCNGAWLAIMRDEGGGEGAVRTLHADEPQTRLAIYANNSCPQCGVWLLAPDWSEYLNERRVRHTW